MRICLDWASENMRWEVNINIAIKID
jgi:hypothetical protein